MTADNLFERMRPDQAARFFRNMAAEGLARDICGELTEWEKDPEFRVGDLPVDELPWNGMVVWARVRIPGSTTKSTAPFLVWMADGDPVCVHAILEDSPDQVVFALVDAMVSPVLGVARRPRIVLVEHPAMEVALRGANELVGHDLTALIDVRVERDVNMAELAQAFVQIHADNQGDEDEDGVASG